MPASRRELLDAAFKYRKHTEDCLTELFATVLSAHSVFARLLFERSGLQLPDKGVEFEAFTQREVEVGCRPDMLVNAVAGPTVHAQLWSEHKTASGFRPLQLEDYFAALRKREFEGGAALIAVVEAPDEEHEGEHWEILTWQDIAELANTAGRAWKKAGWRDAARDPLAPARERLLAELLWYLEEEGFAVVDALNTQNLQALQKSADTTAALEALLERAAVYVERASSFVAVDAGSYQDGSLYWVLFKVPLDSWAQRVHAAGWRADLELMVAGDDGWWPDGNSEPAFGAGLTLAEDVYEPLASNKEWVDALDIDGLTLSTFEDNARLYRTMPMRELIAAGSTLDEQAQVLAQWAKEAFELVGKHDPGERFRPPRRSGRKHGKPSDPDAEDGSVHLSQPVSPTDIRNGRIRIPQGAGKGLFPATAEDVTIVLRGHEVTCSWNPRFGRGTGKRERSGHLRPGRKLLEELVEPESQLALSADESNGAVRLD